MAKHELLLFEGEYDEDEHYDNSTGRIVRGLTPAAKLIVEADELEGPGSAVALAWDLVHGRKDFWFASNNDLPGPGPEPMPKQMHTEATVALLKEKLREVSRTLATVTAELLNTVRD